MLVDDHRAILWGLAQLIAGETPRMQVVGTAGCGAEALALLKRADPDVILLDVDLEDEDGLELLPALLRQSHAHVVIFTWLEGRDLSDRAFGSGAHALLRKDAPATEVLHAIEEAGRHA